VLCANGINDIDATGTETLESLQRNLQSAGINFYASAVKKQVWDVLERAGFIHTLGGDHIFATDAQAVQALQISLPAGIPRPSLHS
jgi:SulP family sulfate permease